MARGPNVHFPMQWIQEFLDRLGKSQADLAAHLGVARPRVSEMIHGKRRLQPNEIAKLARFLGVSPDRIVALIAGQPDPGPANPTVVERKSVASATVLPPLSEMPRDLPILGTVSGGVGGLQDMNGQAVDWARRPPRLAGRTDVFGVYVEDQSMVPAHRPGALLIVERARPPAPGDDVVIEILPANPREERRALIKRLVAINGKIVRLEQYNPPRELEFPRQQVASIYRVMTMSDLLGV